MKRAALFLMFILLGSTASWAARAGDEELSLQSPCYDAIQDAKSTDAKRLQTCAVEFVGRFKVYMQTGGEESNTDAMFAGLQIARILLGDEKTPGLAETNPALYEKALGGLKKLGEREPEAAFDLGLMVQAAWESKYLFAGIHEVGKKERYRALPTWVGTELFGKAHTGYRALVDPFASSSYLKAFSTLAAWWSYGTIAGEGLAEWKADGKMPKAPATVLDFVRPWEAEAIEEESRAAAQRYGVSALASGWTGVTVTRVGASRLAGIRGPFAVKAVAWIGLIAVSIYADHKSEKAVSAVLDKAHERKLIGKFKRSLGDLAEAVNSGKTRRVLMGLARDVTTKAYRLAAHWEGKREIEGNALDIDPRIEEFRTLESGRRALETSVFKVETRDSRELIARSDRARAELASRVARGDFEDTIEGLFLQLSAYFNRTGSPLLGVYADNVFYSRASRGMLVKKVLKQLRDGEVEPDEAKDKLKGEKL